VQAVFVPSREVQQDLEDKGVVPDKLRIFTLEAGAEIADAQTSGGGDSLLHSELNYRVRRGVL
jgi:hypothetical protein